MHSNDIPKPHSLVVMERRERLIAQGLCITCGSRPAVPGPRGGRRYCEQCRLKIKSSNSKTNRMSYREALAQGMCGQCRKRPATPGPNGGVTMCDHCRERQRGYMGRTKRHPKPPVPREDVTQSTISKRPRTESAVYNMADVAGLFGIGYTTIWTMVQDGTFPVKPIRIGRQVKFPKRIVDQMLGIDDD